MSPSATQSDPSNLLAEVKRALVAYHMLIPGDRVLVGVSGGPDSMVLLDLLYRLASDFKISLGVAHLNHGLRGACAAHDARIARQAATRLGLPFYMVRADVARVRQGLKLSLEEAARRVRYAFFKKIMRDANFSKLALGHHLDDNAEQVLMAILRGSGPLGLAGIAPLRQNRILRPLIQVRRSQIEAYAEKNDIPWATDASNQDLRLMRNRIRHHLLPLISSAYNPRIQRQLSQLADVMRTEEEWIDGLITPAYTDAIVGHKEGSLIFNTNALKRMHPALLRRLIRRALFDVCGTLRRISFAHIQDVQWLIWKGTDGKSVHLPRGIRVCINQNQLQISRVKDYRRPVDRQNLADPVGKQIDVPLFLPCTIQFDPMGIGMTFFACGPDQVPPWQKIGPHQAFFDMDRLRLPLTLRSKRPGDRFIPLGGKGSQKVKKYFIDHHISRKDRVDTPILSDQRQPVWLVGHRIDDRVKVTSATSKILAAEFFLLDTR
ncbi:tRNA lysidine(34) synthetase TilS [Desulfosarcina variabilis]|uniref:tRNA lysidine(34) synthetase TilS n=1 Tax=Desulfosarcina variabilis TaxID=2300 RepID=UPI003AFA2F6A